jgi:hypothetical protein
MPWKVSVPARLQEPVLPPTSTDIPATVNPGWTDEITGGDAGVVVVVAPVVVVVDLGMVVVVLVVVVELVGPSTRFTRRVAVALSWSRLGWVRVAVTV